MSRECVVMSSVQVASHGVMVEGLPDAIRHESPNKDDDGLALAPMAEWGGPHMAMAEQDDHHMLCPW